MTRLGDPSSLAGARTGSRTRPSLSFLSNRLSTFLSNSSGALLSSPKLARDSCLCLQSPALSTSAPQVTDQVARTLDFEQLLFLSLAIDFFRSFDYAPKVLAAAYESSSEGDLCSLRVRMGQPCRELALAPRAGRKRPWAERAGACAHLLPPPSPLPPPTSFAKHVGPSHDPTGGVRNQQGQPHELCLLLALGAGLTVVFSPGPLSPSSATPLQAAAVKEYNVEPRIGTSPPSSLAALDQSV